MHPSFHAVTTPDKPAIIMAGSAEVVTYRELDQRSNQAAHLFRSLGLRAADVIAIFMDNDARYLEIAWAAQRSGLYFVCISTKLNAREVSYILNDSGARLLLAGHGLEETARAAAESCRGVLCIALGEHRGS